MVKTLARRTAPHIAVIDGQPTTTSRDIAETFGKRHADVLARIRALDCSKEFNERNFSSVDYADSKGERHQEYRITRDGFAFLCMGFTGAKAAQWKERYINTFNRLADKLAVPARSAARIVAPLPALPAPALRAEVQAAINDRAWAIAGAALAEIKPWLTAQVLKGALNPDGTPAPNFANTLAGADFTAFTTNHASTHIDLGLRLLAFVHKETGELMKRVEQEHHKPRMKP